MGRVVISGGTGFIGRRLAARFLMDGHDVVVLTRLRSVRSASGVASPRFVQWDARTLGSWVGSMEGAMAVINLAGESIGARRWSERQRARIVASRLDATSAIVDGLSQLRTKPQVLVNGSAVGFYGNTGDVEITENSKKGTGFLADTVDRWEREARRVEALGIRLVLLRTGVVLGWGGGALSRMLVPFRLFFGGPLGSGRQWFPWIHIDDVVEIILFSVREGTIEGVLNAVAPNPTTMKEFCRDLGRALNRPSWMPVPELALQLMLGEMSEMILGGQKVVPSRLIQAGLRFQYPELDKALSSVVRQMVPVQSNTASEGGRV